MSRIWGCSYKEIETYKRDRWVIVEPGKKHYIYNCCKQTGVGVDIKLDD